MSKLQDFLNKNLLSEEQTEEVVVSKRLVDENGEYIKFKIKAIGLPEYKAIQKACMKITKNGSEFDTVTHAEKVVLAGTVDPNFRDADSAKLAGCVGATAPIQYMYKVLKSGEILSLSDKILSLSGFGNDIDLVEEAKN